MCFRCLNTWNLLRLTGMTFWISESIWYHFCGCQHKLGLNILSKYIVCILLECFGKISHDVNVEHIVFVKMIFSVIFDELIEHDSNLTAGWFEILWNWANTFMITWSLNIDLNLSGQRYGLWKYVWVNTRSYSTSIYVLKVNNKNTRKMFKVNKDTRPTPIEVLIHELKLDKSW